MYNISKEEWQLLFNNINAYIKTEALNTACDLELFTLLNISPGLTLKKISEKLNISYYSARVLMLCCCTTELIYRDKLTKKYYNSSAAQKMLDANNPDSMLGYVRFNQKIQKPTLEHFTESIRTSAHQGLNAFPGKGSTLYERLASYPEYEKTFQDGLGSYSLWLSSRLLTIDAFSKSKNILDLAGGDATAEILLCRKFPHIKIKILEIPTVCERTNKKIDQLQLADQIKCSPCDVFKDQWPEGYDTIFISHFVEIFSPDKIIPLYKKISDYLPHDGMFILWAATAEDNEERGIQAAKSSMYFLTTAGGGGFTYTIKEHEQWLESAGLSISDVCHFEDIEHTAIIAIKR